MADTHEVMEVGGANHQALLNEIAALKTRLDDLEVGTGTLKAKLIAATRDLTAPNGTQNITGFGFDPKAVVIFGGVTHTAMSFIAAATPGTAGMAAQIGSGAAHYGAAGPHFSQVLGTVHQSASLAFITDGIQLTWTKLGFPAGTGGIYVLAFG